MRSPATGGAVGRSTPRAVLEDALRKPLAGDDLSRAEATALLDADAALLPALLAAASARRDATWGRTLTYSPKVFLPVTNLCRDRCTYCTFRKDPDDPDAWTMEPDEIRAWSERGRAVGCIEALMCLGDKPERAFPAYRAHLAELGHATTADYLRRACVLALEAGLLPHSNAGILTRDEMRALKPVNVSLGLMLENVSPRLRGRGEVHQWAPDKEPSVRLRMLREAGELAIPFTTGLLIGIGETLAERVDTLFAIRDLHRAHGHVQEVIVQNFRVKPTIRRSDAAEPDAGDLARTVAVARLVLDADVSVQAPPNLSAPDDHALLVAAGLNDWGGISPLTPDYVNPEAPWPHVALLAATCRSSGCDLRPRLPIYDGYVDRPGFLDPALRAAVAARTADLVAPAVAPPIRSPEAPPA
jgi:FO synthase